MQNPSTATAIKRHVGGTASSPAPLYVNEYAGEMWATNRFWLIRASRVAPLLEKFNLDPGQPGAYEVNGTVRRATGQVYDCAPEPPNLAGFAQHLPDYQPGIRVYVAGHPAYVMGWRDDVLAVFTLEDGTHAYLEADTLAWLSELDHAGLPEGYRYGGVHMLFHRNSHGIPSAMIRADVIRVIERGHYDNENHEHIPAVEEPAEPRMLGIMMGMKLDG